MQDYVAYARDRRYSQGTCNDVESTKNSNVRGSLAQSSSRARLGGAAEALRTRTAPPRARSGAILRAATVRRRRGRLAVLALLRCLALLRRLALLRSLLSRAVSASANLRRHFFFTSGGTLAQPLAFPTPVYGAARWHTSCPTLRNTIFLWQCLHFLFTRFFALAPSMYASTDSSNWSCILSFTMVPSPPAKSGRTTRST